MGFISSQTALVYLFSAKSVLKEFTKTMMHGRRISDPVCLRWADTIVEGRITP